MTAEADTRVSTTTPQPTPASTPHRGEPRPPGTAWIWVMAAGLFTLYTVVSVRLHERLLSTGFDLGIFEQAVRSYAHGHLPVSEVKELVAKYTQGRTLGFLGEPAVNVLELNIALDQLSAKSSG